VFDVPPLFWTKLCQDASGFFWANKRVARHTRDQDLSHVTCFRLLVKHKASSARTSISSLGYRWEKLGFASRWRPQGSLVLLCFDLPPYLQQKIGEDLLNDSTAQYGRGPFSLHPMLLMHIVESFDRAVWSWRDVVRGVEKTRPDHKAVAEHSFEHMHETARHVIHSSEMLATAVSVAEAVIKEASVFPSLEHDLAHATILKDLEFHVSLLTSFRNRSQALERRLDNEINLASRAWHAPKAYIRGLLTH
jgi:hypothetical protein